MIDKKKHRIAGVRTRVLTPKHPKTVMINDLFRRLPLKKDGKKLSKIITMNVGLEMCLLPTPGVTSQTPPELSQYFLVDSTHLNDAA